MIKQACLLVLSFFFLPIASSAHAETSVNISGNEDGSTSHVEIKNSQNTSSINGRSTSGKTTIKINVNGEEKTYTTESNHDISVESNNGKTKVNINNSGSPTPSRNSNEDVATELEKDATEIQKDIDEKMQKMEKEINENQKEIKEKSSKIQLYVQTLLDHIFKIFGIERK